MNTSAITPLQNIMPLNTERVAQSDNSNSLFGDIFQSAIGYVQDTDTEKNQAEYLLATGQLDNPAELTIASEKASVAVDLLVQLRNKAMAAYSQIMQINL